MSGISAVPSVLVLPGIVLYQYVMCVCVCVCVCVMLSLCKMERERGERTSAVLCYLFR
jgi:energy-converting hydrogenase Eha subunit A